MNSFFKLSAVLIVAFLSCTGYSQVTGNDQITISENEIKTYLELLPLLTNKENKLKDGDVEAAFKKHDITDINEFNRLAKKVGEAYAFCKAEKIAKDLNQSNNDVKMTADSKMEHVKFSKESLVIVSKYLPELDKAILLLCKSVDVSGSKCGTNE